MQIRAGFELIYECPQPTPMILILNIHYTRASDVVVPDHLVTTPSLPISMYRDSFGNWCSRLVAPAGVTSISTDALVNDSGLPYIVAPDGKVTVAKPVVYPTRVDKGYTFIIRDVLTDLARTDLTASERSDYERTLRRVSSIVGEFVATAPFGG